VPGPDVVGKTPMASSSSLGGKTREIRREVKRSITSASASTEQINRGQMGQPAATMIENKDFLQLAPSYKCAGIIHRPWLPTSVGRVVGTTHRLCG